LRIHGATLPNPKLRAVIVTLAVDTAFKYLSVRLFALRG
jgi:hypothetical protein